MLTLSELAEELLEKYGIEVTPNRINSFKMYIRRMIDENEDLKIRYENLPTKKVAKTKAKLFNDTFIKIIENNSHKHLLKIQGIKESDYEEESNNTKKHHLSFQLDHQSKINMFIEHLFYEKYNFDEESYKRDINSFKAALRSGNEFTPADTQLLTKIKNPRKYYISKKTKRK